MRIDLNDIVECRKCGILFNGMIAGKPFKETDYAQTVFYKGSCPFCNTEFSTLFV